jgi:hypothetical protein
VWRKLSSTIGWCFSGSEAKKGELAPYQKKISENGFCSLTKLIVILKIKEIKNTWKNSCNYL